MASGVAAAAPLSPLPSSLAPPPSSPPSLPSSPAATLALLRRRRRRRSSPHAPPMASATLAGVPVAARKRMRPSIMPWRRGQSSWSVIQSDRQSEGRQSEGRQSEGRQSEGRDCQKCVPGVAAKVRTGVFHYLRTQDNCCNLVLNEASAPHGQRVSDRDGGGAGIE
eukprot:97533-Chlamydomonas_euryale.AAC.2